MYTIADLILSDRDHGNWQNIMVRSHFGNLLQFAPTHNQNSVLLNAIVYSFALFPGCLKLLMDTHLVNQNPVIMLRLKQRLVMMFWVPK